MKTIILFFTVTLSLQAFSAESKKEDSLRRPASVTSGQFYCDKQSFSNLGKGYDGKIADYMTTNCNTTLPFSTVHTERSIPFDVIICCTAR